jgi:hypothetical protein
MFARTTTEATTMTMTDTARLTELLSHARWRWASSYAKHHPHHYSLASTWNPDDFIWAVAALARLGVERPFGKNRSFVYFDWEDAAGSWCSWCMDGAAETELINKARRRNDAATITP